jgi:uncharacterized membrane protein YoaK (UPF0700 family)
MPSLAVSHITGTATQIGLNVARANLSLAVWLAGVLLAFFLGATCSGILIDHGVLKLGRRYSWALLLEATFLMVALIGLRDGYTWGLWFASAACGLQNGMVSTYSGAIVRTTHMTGILTDLGTMAGAALRRQSLDRRRAGLLLWLLTGYIAGSGLGGLLYPYWQATTLALPALGALSLALIYGITAPRMPS